MTLLKINRLLPIYISIVPLRFEVDIQSQTKVRVRKPKKSNMAARQPFWKWHHWKSIGFCLCPPSTCIWNLKLKFQSKLDLCSGNHVIYRQTDRRTDGRTRWIQYTPPPTSLGGGIKITKLNAICHYLTVKYPIAWWPWASKTTTMARGLKQHFLLCSISADKKCIILEVRQVNLSAISSPA